MRRVYIATPINGRHDGRDFKEKLAFAKHRVDVLKQVLSDEPAFKECEFVSTFDIHNGTMPSEAKAMGDCITLVLSCDAIYLDHGWLQSRGCNLEYRAAKIYGLEIYDHDKL